MTLLAQALTEEGGVVEFMGGMPSPDAVRDLEAVLLLLPQTHIDTTTLTHGQVSARAMLVPKGQLLTGAQTNFDNVCIVIGDITVTTDEGARRLTGFHMLPANRGSKRVGETHAPTLWITCHHTTLTEQRAIEDEMTTESSTLNSRHCALESS